MRHIVILFGYTSCTLILLLSLLYIGNRDCLQLQCSDKVLHSILKDASMPYSSVSVKSQYVLDYSQPIRLPVECIPIVTIRGKIPICVHDNPEEFITKTIRTSGTWEYGISQSLQNILVANPDYGVLDIGANLGIFSLLAANLGIPALSVEAMDINVEKFHQSIVINHFQRLITLVTKPLSDKRETLQLIAGFSNLGMSRLVNAGHNTSSLNKETYLTQSKKTLLLDDLIDLMPRKKAVMVIDVEGNEGRIIRGGQRFFDAIHISHVFMEWNLLSGNDREFLVGFLSERGYKPYAWPSFKQGLELAQNASWPPNVFWKKADTQ